MNKMIGASLLMIGTSIGGGMLALPVVTAASGFYKGTILLIACWFIMTVSSFLILEVNLWLPERTNLISMAKKTLGVPGQVLMWIGYCLILYSVLCAYTSGGGSLLYNLSNHSLHLPIPKKMTNIIYIILLGSIVWAGPRWVDYGNRILMSAKIGAFAILVLLIFPHSSYNMTTIGSSTALAGASLIAITSFSFSVIIPSMRDYLKSNIKQLRIAILTGGTIPLLCYILWLYLIQSTIPTYGSNGLISMHHGATINALTNALSHIAKQNHWLASLAHFFITICMFTAFLTSSLSLSDFIADGINMPKKGKYKWVVYGLVFIPIIVILSLFPDIFIVGLKFAGVFCVISLCLLPIMMVWRGRYHKKITNASFQVTGGKPLLVLIFMLGTLAVISNLLYIR